MTGATIYPPADRTSQWWWDRNQGVNMGGVDKVLLHSTETTSWPGYSGGASCPNLTYHPGLRRWRQHLPLNWSARALVDPSGTAVRENRDRVVQAEIVCYADHAKAATVGGLPSNRLPAAALDDLGDFLAFMHTEWGVPLESAWPWPRYPASYGAWAGRMSGPAYDAFRGLCGHMHASGNVHGDPGDIDAAAILRRAGTITTPPPGGDDLDATQDLRLTQAWDSVTPGVEGSKTAGALYALVDTLAVKVDVLTAQLAQVAAKVDTLTPTTPPADPPKA